MTGARTETEERRRRFLWRMGSGWVMELDEAESTALQPCNRAARMRGL